MNPLEQFIQQALAAGADDGEVYQFLKEQGHGDEQIRAAWRQPGDTATRGDVAMAAGQGLAHSATGFMESIASEATNPANPLDIIAAAGKAGIKSLPHLPQALAETGKGVWDMGKLALQKAGVVSDPHPEQMLDRVRRGGETLGSLALMDVGGRAIRSAVGNPPPSGGPTGNDMALLPPEPVTPPMKAPEPAFRSAPSVLPQIEHTIDPNLGPQQARMNQPRVVRAPVIEPIRQPVTEKPQLTSRTVAPEYQYKHPEPPYEPKMPVQAGAVKHGDLIFEADPKQSHWQAWDEAAKSNIDLADPNWAEGFLDQAGKFITRDEAVKAGGSSTTGAAGVTPGKAYGFPEIAPSDLTQIQNLTQGLQESIPVRDIQQLEATGKSLAKPKVSKPPASIAKAPTPPELTPAEQAALSKRLGNSGGNIGGKDLYSSLGLGSPYFWYRFGPQILRKLGKLGTSVVDPTGYSPTILGLPFAQDQED